ncbi:flavin mononucleotide hydrolase 1, chloroplatic isoform X2 [Panicum hallii]|uniref:flavin mononucleotide hydrolase 1, chloroplatic isoform X2 n=1 Tax=Panicum hallii TaxID=206008 RepID=UPI000DF4D0B1|nr:flavin mononucleotide hydrolase 1, chloroplatic isoform X2 [Panicum hallii]
MVSLLPRAPYLASLPKSASSSLRPSPPAMSSSSSAARAEAVARPRKLPVLLFDVMDTLVRDPFYHHIPAFFKMSMKELLESKHPTAWSEFEKGLIDENELAKKFFNDGRCFDLEGLKECMLIEDKLKLSKYLSWTFCSCRTGKRKPSPEFYLQAIDHLNVDPASCIFIDDRMVNIEAALSVGMVGLQFKNAEALRKDLCALGVELPPLVCEGEAQVQ